MRIALLDYGAGNLPSVERALRSLGVETQRVRRPDELRDATAVVLPGVGHFAALACVLDEFGWRAALRAALTEGLPYLGICLGLQVLFEESEEAPGQPGLGLFPGCVQALPRTVKLPHMGWNQVRHREPNHLLAGLPEQAYFYFAHSYAAVEDAGFAVAHCDYGLPFLAALEHDNIYAVQFHPEKSSETGMRVLRNFVESIS